MADGLNGHGEQVPDNFSEDFEKFITEARFRDRGVVLFEESMSSAAEDILNLSKGHASTPLARSNRIIDELNQGWSYTDEVATVSGFVYLSDSSYLDRVPASWGDAKYNETTGSYYYDVDDVKLRSGGVSYDYSVDGAGLVDGVSIDYVFSIPEDGDSEPIFTASPKSLTSHDYGRPTDYEEVTRFTEDYPDIHKAVLSHLGDDMTTTNFLSSVDNLAAEIGDRVGSNQALKRAVNIYLDTYYPLDDDFPWSAKVNGEVHINNPSQVQMDNSDEPRMLVVNLPEETRLIVSSPRIQFIKLGNSTTAPAIVGIVQSDEYEVVALPVAGIEFFASTKMHGTLAERAIEGYVKSTLGQDEAIENARLASEESSNSIHVASFSEVTLSDDSTETEAETSTEDPIFLEYYDHLGALEYLDSLIEDFVSNVKALSELVFETKEEAIAAADAFSASGQYRALVAAGLLNWNVDIKSNFIAAAKTDISSGKDENSSLYKFILSVDQDDPLLETNFDYTGELEDPSILSDGVSGGIAGFIINHRELEDGDYGLRGVFYVNMGTELSQIVSDPEVKLSILNVSVDRYALVGLDDIDLNISYLKAQRNVINAMNRVYDVFGEESDVAASVKSVWKFFIESSKTMETMQLDGLGDLTALAQEYQSADKGSAKRAVITAVLESFLVSAAIGAEGVIIPVVGDNLEDAEADSSEDSFVSGEVMDVFESNHADDIVIAISNHDASKLYHLPLSTIDKLYY